MVRSILASRVARMAMAPAGAAATITMTSLLLGEHTSSKVSSRVAFRSMDTANKFLLQRRMLASSSEPAKKAAIAESVASASSKTVAAEAVVPRQSFVQWYEGHLQARPVWTKMCTGTILWSAGDCVAQVVPRMASSDANLPPFHYDWPRTGRAAFFGFALHAPTSHVHYNFLEWLTNRLGVTGLYITVFKTIMEQFVYWSWISNSMYHGAMGAMQGLNLEQIYNRIADVLWETQKAQWVFWIPVQLLNFRFVPVRHQLNVVLLTSIVWTALLSAWYPPQPEVGQHSQVEQQAVADETKPIDEKQAKA